MNKSLEVCPHGELATAAANNQLPVAQWSITSLNSSDDKDNSTIIIALTGTFYQNEIITADLGLTHAHSTKGRYTDILTAISISVAANPDLSFNVLTDKLSYTSPSNGASMTNLRVDLPKTKDQLINTPENYSLRLANPTASTDTQVEVNPTLANVSISNGNSQTLEKAEKPPAQLYINDLVTAYKTTSCLTTKSPSDALEKNHASIAENKLTDSQAKIPIKANFKTTIDKPVTITPSIANEPEPCIQPSNGTTADTPNLPLTSVDLNISNDRHRQGGNDDTFITTSSSDDTDLCDKKVSTRFASTHTTASPNKNQGLWSITGPATVANGDNAVFVVSLGGFYRVGQHISADINLMGIDTNSDDFNAAISSAADNNPSVSFAGTTLSYTAPYDGAAMTDLLIELKIGAAAITQTSCLFSVGLTRPTSNTFTTISITPGAQSVTTYVNSAPSSIVDNVLSIAVSDVMPCQITDPDAALVDSHDHVSLVKNDDPQHAALANKTESNGNSAIPTEIDSITSSKTEQSLHTINRIAGVHTPNAIEPRLIPIAELSTPLSPHDHHVIDANPAIPPADPSMRFSVSKEITDTESSITGDHCGKILFESFITGDVINIHVSNTIGDQSNGISSYSATVRNGQSLPNWINFSQAGHFIINRSRGEDVVTLRLIATRNSGDRTAVLFETNTLTGEISLSEKNHQSTKRAAAAHA